MSDTEDLSGTVWRAPNGLAAWEIELLTGEQKDPAPSDVRDGDLLTGTLYGNPFTDWVVHVGKNGDLLFGNFDRIRIGDPAWGSFVTFVTVTARKPAPSPPLPWVEHPDSLWQDEYGDVAHSSSLIRASDDPKDWTRVYVIPADLIENLRRAFDGPIGSIDHAADAILHAADAK